MATTPTTAPATAAFSVKEKIVIAILFLGILGGLYLLFHAWLAEHDERVKAEASVASLQKSIDQLGADKQQLVDQQKQRDAQTADQIAKITTAAAAVKTPAQIVKWLPAQLGTLPAPVTAAIAPATAQDPMPPAVITIPQVDLSKLKATITACQTNAVALPSAQQDLSSCEARAKLDDQQLADAKKEVQDLQVELKGGTFWHRLKAGAKKVAIGAAIGAAVGVALQCKTGHCK